MNRILHHHQPTKRRAGFRRSAAKQVKTWRSQVGVVAVAAVMVAGCSSTGSPPGHGPSGTQAAAHGVEARIGSVPWSQVGPGWLLATWSPTVDTGPGASPPPGTPTPERAPATLYLVDPAGGRYSITTFPPSSGEPPQLVDWSGDGSRALVTEGDSTAIIVELHTGKQTTITAHGQPHFSRPDGKTILVSSGGHGDGPATLNRVDLAGHPQLTYPTDKLGSTFNGGYLSTHDGAQLVLGTDNGMALVSNDGVVDRQLPSPMPGAGCSPVRWWTATEILASCTNHSLDPYKTSAQPTQLWRIPLNGGAPTALTTVNPSDGSDPAWLGDFGDTNAWQLPGGTYLQSLPSCGPWFLSRLTPDKHTTKVTVPGVNGQPPRGAVVVGVDGTALDLMATSMRGCAGGGRQSSLLRYDPAANTSTVLLGPSVNGGIVNSARSYPGPQ
jgi:hypothetical protein